MFEGNTKLDRSVNFVGNKLIASGLKRHSESVQKEIDQGKYEEHRKKLYRNRAKPFVHMLENDDEGYHKKIRHLAPEATYEIWNQEPNLLKNINRFVSQNEVQVKAEEIKEEGDMKIPDENDGKNGSDGGDDADEQKPPTKFLSRAEAYADTHLNLKKLGLEILPHIGPHNDQVLYHTGSYRRRHSVALTSVMYINVLRRNWKVAYRCFSMLIRIRLVDLRAIWPIGLEILTRLAEEKVEEKHPDANEYNLRTFFKGVDNPDTVDVSSTDEQYLNWLRTQYGIASYYLDPSRDHSIIPYRMGTQFMPPMYVQSLIWLLLTKQKFQTANELLEELLNKRTYFNDGLFHFLQGYSYQLEAAMLSNEKSNIDVQRIEKLISDSNKFYNLAKTKKASFPEKMLNTEMNLIKTKMINDLEFGRDLDEDNEDFFTGDEGEDAELRDIIAKTDFDKFEDANQFEDDISFISRNPDSDLDDFDQPNHDFDDLDGGDDDDDDDF
jgi:RNA polymerase I-specific transcription initiation factor RRN11